MTASIVIPAYNASATIGLVLAALTRQDFFDFEVILIDDASTDNTVELAAEFSTKLSLNIHRIEENLGRARARNFGVEKSSGEVVLLLDSDIETISNYVSSHLALHERQSRAVGVGALRYPPHLAKKALARYYSSRGGERLKPGEALPGKAFLSCLASFPRSLFDELGGFHAGFRIYGGEDLELGLRFQKSGAALTYLPSAIGYHHHLRTLKEVVRTLAEYGKHGIPQVLDLHPDFAVQMKLDDLHKGTFNQKRILRTIATSGIFFRPLLEIASAFESNKLPSALLTYLIYCSCRRGYAQSLRSGS